jgi:hypothetical protein
MPRTRVWAIALSVLTVAASVVVCWLAREFAPGGVLGGVLGRGLRRRDQDQ